MLHQKSSLSLFLLFTEKTRFERENEEEESNAPLKNQRGGIYRRTEIDARVRALSWGDVFFFFWIKHATTTTTTRGEKASFCDVLFFSFSSNTKTLLFFFDQKK